MKRGKPSFESWAALSAFLQVMVACASEEWSISVDVGSSEAGAQLIVNRISPTQGSFYIWGVRQVTDPRMPEGHVHYVRDPAGRSVRLTAPGPTSRVPQHQLSWEEEGALLGADQLPLCVLIADNLDAWREALEKPQASTDDSLKRVFFEAAGADVSNLGNGPVEAIVAGPATSPLAVYSGENAELRVAVEDLVCRLQGLSIPINEVHIKVVAEQGDGCAFDPEADPFSCGRQVLARDRSAPTAATPTAKVTDGAHELIELPTRDAIRRGVDAGLPTGRFGITLVGRLVEAVEAGDLVTATMRASAGGAMPITVPEAVWRRYPPSLWTSEQEIATVAAVDAARREIVVAQLAPSDWLPIWDSGAWSQLQLPAMPPPPLPSEMDIATAAGDWSVDVAALQNIVKAFPIRAKGAGRPRKPTAAAWFDLARDQSYQAWVRERPSTAPNAYRLPAYLREEPHRRILRDWSVQVRTEDIPTLAGMLVYSPWLWESAVKAKVDLPELRELEKRLGVGRAEENVKEQAGN